MTIGAYLGSVKRYSEPVRSGNEVYSRREDAETDGMSLTIAPHRKRRKSASALKKHRKITRDLKHYNPTKEIDSALIKEFELPSNDMSERPDQRFKRSDKDLQLDYKREEDVSQKIKKAEKYTLYSMADEILRNVRIIRHHGELYYYTGRTYQAINDEENLLELIRSQVRNDAFLKTSTGVFRDLLTFMRADRRLIPPDYEKRLKDGKYYVVFKNGVLNLKTMELLQHSPEYLTFYELKAKWHRNLSARYFEQFLRSVSGGDYEIELRIKESMGYLLSPINEGKLFFVMGTAPNSGKSTLGRLLRQLIGEAYVSSLSTQKLAERFALGNAHGKILNISMDLPNGKVASTTTAIIKQITGGDTITSERKYDKQRELHSDMRFLFASNFPVTVSQSDDDAFWDRMVIIPFPVSIKRENMDKELLEKLLEEKDAIIALCLQAFHKVLQRNYLFSVCSQADVMKREWRYKEPDYTGSIQPFMEDCIEITGRKSDGIFFAELYEKYCDYCEENGFEATGRHKLRSWILANEKLCDKTRMRLTEKNPRSSFSGMRWKRREKL